MEKEFEDCFEEVAAVNSEMRFIALELMKIANARNISFHQVAQEYIANTNTLKLALANAENQIGKKK